MTQVLSPEFMQQQYVADRCFEAKTPIHRYKKVKKQLHKGNFFVFDVEVLDGYWMKYKYVSQKDLMLIVARAFGVESATY